MCCRARTKSSLNCQSKSIPETSWRKIWMHCICQQSEHVRQKVKCQISPCAHWAMVRRNVLGFTHVASVVVHGDFMAVEGIGASEKCIPVH